MNTSSSSLISSIVTANFQGLSGPGHIIIPGLLPGDIVMTGTVSGLPIWDSFATYFETVVTIAGQFQQISGNLSGPNFVVYFIRPIL